MIQLLEGINGIRLPLAVRYNNRALFIGSELTIDEARALVQPWFAEIAKDTQQCLHAARKTGGH